MTRSPGRSGPLGTMVNNLSLTPGKVNQAVDDVSSRINTLLDKITVISDNLTDISVKTRGIIGDLSTNLDEISQNLKQMTADLKNTQGLAKRLLDPKGSIDTFLNDSNELYNQVDTALKNANGIISAAARLRGFHQRPARRSPASWKKATRRWTRPPTFCRPPRTIPLLKGGVPPRPQQTSPSEQLQGRKLLMNEKLLRAWIGIALCLPLIISCSSRRRNQTRSRP